MSNKINYRQIALCFCVPWFVVYLLFVGLGIINVGGIANCELPVKTFIISLLVPAFLYLMMGVGLNKVAQSKFRLTYKVVLISIAGLVALDQGIKGIIIPKGDMFFPIIEKFIYIYLKLHTGHFLSDNGILTIPLMAYVFLPFVLAYVHLATYGRAKYNGENINYLYILTIFLYAIVLCFYIDKALYGGSYNYIYLYGVSVSDLKDAYGMIAICAVMLYRLNRVYSISKEDLKKERKDPFCIKYVAYEYGNIKQWLRDRKAKRLI
jgi:hypothetical protein